MRGGGLGKTVVLFCPPSWIRSGYLASRRRTSTDSSSDHDYVQSLNTQPFLKYLGPFTLKDFRSQPSTFLVPSTCASHFQLSPKSTRPRGSGRRKRLPGPALVVDALDNVRGAIRLRLECVDDLAASIGPSPRSSEVKPSGDGNQPLGYSRKELHWPPCFWTTCQSQLSLMNRLHTKVEVDGAIPGVRVSRKVFYKLVSPMQQADPHVVPVV